MMAVARDAPGLTFTFKQQHVVVTGQIGGGTKPGRTCSYDDHIDRVGHHSTPSIMA
jgi:hypothetical protein